MAVQQSQQAAYMIARPVLGAHICLRCQVRLSKHLTLANAISTIHTRSPRGARQVHDEATSEISEGAGETKIRRMAPKPEIIYRKLFLTNRLTERPIGRLHGFRGYQLREQYQPLGVDTLGNQSEVIVLRESGLLYSPPPEMEEEAVEKVDIIARVEAERGLPSQSEINNNLDDVRPKVRLLSTEEFKSVEQQLNDGFTTSQLVRYIESFGQDQKKTTQEDPDLPPKHAIWTLGWMPGVSTSPNTFDEESLRGYISAAYTPKQRLVLHILRQYWDIEVTDVIESLGEIELHIDSSKLELLIKGKHPSLRKVSDNLISLEDEKIEAFRNRSVIRITAPKLKANRIVQAIQEELARFNRVEIDLTPLLPAPKKKSSNITPDGIDDADIAELARISGTEIQKLENNRLEISCINNDPEGHLSTQIDVARRYLLTSADASHNNFKQFRLPTSTGTISAVKYEQTDNMPWRDRLHSWVRWVSPVSKLASNEPGKEKKGFKEKATRNDIKLSKARLVGEEQLPFPVGMSQQELNEDHISNVVPKSRGYISWDHKYFTTTSILVGHILHRVESDIPTATKPTDGTMRFVPSALNVSKLFGKADFNQLQERSAVVMKFRPSPWTSRGAEALTKFPLVEMRFQVNPETHSLELKDVFALAEIATSDIMVPDRGLDLRFQQRTTSRLRELHYRTLPQIQDFLAISQLNTALGPLKTPPTITLPISQHLTGLQSAPNVIEDAETPLDVEYLFAGLEYRKTLAVPFGNWRLLYTSIDGGKGEGRRTELSLRPRRTHHRDDAEKQSGADGLDVKTQDFIDTAYHLLDVLEDGDPIRRVHIPVKARRVTSQVDSTGPPYRDGFTFKYFKRTITFTGAPGEEELTTSKSSEVVEDEEVPWAPTRRAGRRES